MLGMGAGAGTDRTALYVYPGDFERRGLINDGDSWEPALDGRTETQYIVAGARVVWQHRTHGIALDVDQRVTFAVTNLIQSTSAVIDLTTGEIVEVSGYYPNGAREEALGASEALGGGGIPFEVAGFTGKEADEEVALTYFGERYLVQRLGRWATPDPLSVHAAGGGEALNAYHYVSGNLLQARDPLGLHSSKDFGALLQVPVVAKFFSKIAQPVHQQIIDKALGPRMAERDLKILKDQQKKIDKDQSNDVQHKHAMRGKGQTREDAIEQANTFVRDSIQQAIGNEQAYIETGDNRYHAEAMRQLGNAIHTLQDATSPAHEGFQMWDKKAPLKDKGAHGMQENQYPSSERARRAESATIAAHEAFVNGVSSGKPFREVAVEDAFDAKTGEVTFGKEAEANSEKAVTDDSRSAPEHEVEETK